MVAVALGVLATQVIGTPTGTVAALQALTPWFVAPLLIAVGVGATTRRYRVSDAAAAVVVGYLVLLVPPAIPTNGPTAVADATEVTVMTTNVLYSNPEHNAVADLIAEHRPDLVAFSEVTEPFADALADVPVADEYPHRVVAAGSAASGMMVWSRHPLSQVGRSSTTWRSIDVTLELDSGSIRVVSVHPPPPVFDHGGWLRDLRRLDDIVAERPVATALIGDFNASYFHPPFRQALDDARLRDAFRETGNSMGFTWPTDELVPPFVTLDHVLVTDDLAVIDGEIVAVPGSNHHAILAEIAAAG